MIGKDKKDRKGRKETASNSSHFTILSVKLLHFNGLPESFGSSFS